MTKPGDELLDETAASEPAPPRGGRDGSDEREAAGARIGRYRIEGVLGHGAMATVYSARDLTLHRQVALKLIRAGDDEAAIRRLVREAQAIAKISHPNVIHVYDVGWEPDGRVYIAMERIAGATLDRWTAQAPPTPAQLCEVFAAAGRGLAAAHAAGLIHRDFKPQNVIVGDDGQVRVLDFGLACAADPDHEIDSGGRLGGMLVGVGARVTAAGALIGTPAYMSPEQWRGTRADARSDQFSFCVSLFEAVAGRHPFDASSRMALRASVLAGLPPGAIAELPSAVPRTLRRVMERGLAADPAARFPSMQALVAQLQPSSRAPGRRRRVALATAALTVAAAATGLALLARRGETLRPHAALIYQAPERITARGDLARAALAPDEQTLAYLTNDALIVQALRRDAEPRVLLRGALGYHALAWSPDGSQLALVAAAAVPGASPAARPPGLMVVDVASGAARRIGPDVGAIAFVGEHELVAARFNDSSLRYLSTTADTGAAGEAPDATDARDARGAPPPPLRTCPLPGPFSGIRALSYQPASDSVLVELDQGDRASKIVRVAARCARVTGVFDRLQALSWVARRGDDRLFARLMYRHDLVELRGPRATPEAAATVHLVQSNDYVPLAIRADRSIVHLDSSARWQLFSISGSGGGGARRELLAGADDSRFAFAPDGTTVAHISGVYRDGVLRVGALASLPDSLISRSVQLGKNAARAAWSPDGSRLAVLFQNDHGYELASWDRASGQMSRPFPVPLPYDGGMTWIDDDRVAFGVPPRWRGFLLADPASHQLGQLDTPGTGINRALARAPRSGQLAFLSETDDQLELWTTGAGAAGTPRLLAEIAMVAPRATRMPGLLWTHDERALLLYDMPTGELWTIDAATGAATALPAISLPRSGGFTRVNEIFSLANELVIETVTSSADVYVSKPVAEPR
jgi:tRNA A-37 threonylcarbamoyl transferase component Bud32